MGDRDAQERDVIVMESPQRTLLFHRNVPRETIAALRHEPTSVPDQKSGRLPGIPTRRGYRDGQLRRWMKT